MEEEEKMKRMSPCVMTDKDDILWRRIQLGLSQNGGIVTVTVLLFMVGSYV